MTVLSSSPWPGNVRQLENVVRRTLMVTSDLRIRPDHLPPDMQGEPEGGSCVGLKDAVRAREDKMSTGLQDGIAVPHGKTQVVSSLQLAIGISPAGIDFKQRRREGFAGASLSEVQRGPQRGPAIPPRA